MSATSPRRASGSNKWIDNGGVLVRFAGPHLAGATDDDLVPVKLRRGGRILGGSLSWEKPQQLAGFSRDGPFAGMTVPNDVTVTRQVLAEPDAQLTDRTWATLADGTPLVTAQRRGNGLLVLFHVTADTRWSDLPLSGTFVEMLRRIVALAGASASGQRRSRRGRRHAGQRTSPCRRPACSTASAPSRCRRRPPGRSRPISKAAPMSIIRPASTARRKAWSRSTRWRPTTGRRRSIFRRSTPTSTSIAMASRSTCAARCSSRRLRCCCSTRWWSLRSSGGFASLLARRRVATALLAAGLAAAPSCRIRRQAQTWHRRNRRPV